MARRKIIIDTETSGLNPVLDQLLEVSWVDVDDMFCQIKTLVLPHNPEDVSDKVAAINGYHDRGLSDESKWATPEQIEALFAELDGVTLVGANPAFDAAFLREYAGDEGLPANWHYRLLDIESAGFFMGGFEDVPGLIGVWQWFQDIHDEIGLPAIPKPDHTAEGDVRCVWSLLRLMPRVFGQVPAITDVPEDALAEPTA
jgi:DNA polymerase III epsilon subunit-like protein